MDSLLETVRSVAADYYHVYGELGRESADDRWYLAKEREGGRLVALRLCRVGTTPDGKPDFEMEVARELDGKVSVGMGECLSCGGELRRWARFCTHCGADLSTDGSHPSSPGARAALLEQVRAAAKGVYDVLGEMPWAGGAGIVYFAVELSSQRLVRLRLTQQAEGFELGETRVMLPPTLSATYVTSQLPPVGGGHGRPGLERSIVAEAGPAVAGSGRDTPAALPPGTVRILGQDYDAVVALKVVAATAGIVILVLLTALILS